MNKESPDITVREWSTETYYYQPFPGAEWAFIYEPQADGLIKAGLPVKRIKMTYRSETETLS